MAEEITIVPARGRLLVRVREGQKLAGLHMPDKSEKTFDVLAVGLGVDPEYKKGQEILVSVSATGAANGDILGIPFDAKSFLIRECAIAAVITRKEVAKR